MELNNSMRSQSDGREFDSANSGLDALELALRRIADREEISRKLTDSDDTPGKLGNARQPLTSTGKTNSNSRGGSVTLSSASSNPQGESVTLPSASSFRKSGLAGQETTPTTSPVFAGFTRNGTYGEGRRTDERDFDQRGIEDFTSLGHGDLVSRLHEVQEFYSEAFPHEKGSTLQIKEIGLTDDTPYYRYSPTDQFSPTNRAQPESVPERFQTGPGVVPERFHAGRESLSVTRNVTIRESKRPKARSQDRDYKRRSSISDQIPDLNQGFGGSSGGETQAQHKSFHGQGFSSHENVQSYHPPHHLNSSHHRVNHVMTLDTDQGFSNGDRRVADCTFPLSSRGNGEDDRTRQTQGGRYPVPGGHKLSDDGAGGGNSPSGIRVRGGQTPGTGDYVINLTYEGHLTRHQVNQHMLVEELATEAANTYHLNGIDLVLMLFGMNPQTLLRQNRLSDPPRVGPGATVLVFCIAGYARRMGEHLNPPPAYTRYPDGGNNVGLVPTPSYLGSKILGNFKLPKFDGNARYWKTWDKNFIRFLSIHQLDFVVEESFMDLLPLTPSHFEANKMVYYILEDAIVPGSLAAKYLRQAAKWNGYEAYSKLHNGYVFSGPQTMSLLLAELVNIRFKADESASGFCLRLREVFEDLEMVPGPSSITMNDTQKIGYLLSGIRQEKTLQSVYVALQDKQVRGAITFEEACDDLHHRCEAIRADEMLNTPVRDQRKTLVSTHGKRQNKGKYFVSVSLRNCGLDSVVSILGRLKIL